MQKNKSIKTLYFLIVCLFTSLAIPSKAFAQEVSMSITPPLMEITIQPGKSYTQTFTVKNSGVPVVVEPKIIPFTPLDEDGHVELLDDQKNVDNFDSWFFYDKSPIPLGVFESHDFIVKITPPIEASEKDYYFTFVVATNNEGTLSSNNSISQMRIGANILLSTSIDGNTERNAVITTFLAPKLIDSFTPLIYKILLTNTGKNYFKPIGKIYVDQIFGSSYTLNIAPLNILSGGYRKVYCMNGEDISQCRLPSKFLFGIYKSKLSFALDEAGNNKIEKEIYTFAFPIYITLGLIVITIVLIFIPRIIRKIDR